MGLANQGWATLGKAPFAVSVVSHGMPSRILACSLISSVSHTNERLNTRSSQIWEERVLRACAWVRSGFGTCVQLGSAIHVYVCFLLCTSGKLCSGPLPSPIWAVDSEQPKPTYIISRSPYHIFSQGSYHLQSPYHLSKHISSLEAHIVSRSTYHLSKHILSHSEVTAP